MDETPLTLLQRLRNQADTRDWQRLVQLYTPLLQTWLRRHLLQDADREDLVQEVLAVLIREVPQFQHNGQCGAFRSWLRGMLANRLRLFWRKRAQTPHATGDSEFLQRLQELEDPQSQLSARWNEEHDRQVLVRCLQMVAQDFEPATWQAFRRLTLDGLRAADVAAELGISVNAVYIAKSRVMSRLQQELTGLVDTDLPFS